MDTLAIYELFRSVLGEGGAKQFAITLGRMIEEARNAATKDDIRSLEGHADRLDAALLRLAEAQTRTEAGLERLEATVDKLAEAQARAGERLERLEVTVDKLAEAQQRTEWAVTQLARQVGGLSEAIGANLEDFACELVPEVLEKHWGMQVTSATREELDVGGAPREFDVVVRGTVAGRPVIVLGETKARVTSSEAIRFLRLVAQVRAERPGDDIRPIFFGYRANREAQEVITGGGGSMVFSRGIMIQPH